MDLLISLASIRNYSYPCSSPQLLLSHVSPPLLVFQGAQDLDGPRGCLTSLPCSTRSISCTLCFPFLLFSHSQNIPGATSASYGEDPSPSPSLCQTPPFQHSVATDMWKSIWEPNPTAGSTTWRLQPGFISREVTEMWFLQNHLWNHFPMGRTSSFSPVGLQEELAGSSSSQRRWIKPGWESIIT